MHSPGGDGQSANPNCQGEVVQASRRASVVDVDINHWHRRRRCDPRVRRAWLRAIVAQTLCRCRRALPRQRPHPLATPHAPNLKQSARASSRPERRMAPRMPGIGICRASPWYSRGARALCLQLDCTSWDLADKELNPPAGVSLSGTKQRNKAETTLGSAGLTARATKRYSVIWFRVVPEKQGFLCISQLNGSITLMRG